MFGARTAWLKGITTCSCNGGDSYMIRRSLTDAEIRTQIPAARRRAERLLRTTPHAEGARYDRRSRQLHIHLTNGAGLVVPIALIPGLRTAADKDLSEVEVGPLGIDLHWERLDADITVASLARLILGSQGLLRAAGSAGGSVRTTAKARAARLNGRKGGRPRKTSVE